MTQSRYPIVWDLDSLFPNPETGEFESIVEAHRAKLDTAARDSESLPQANATNSVEWAAFLKRFEDIEREAHDLESVIACHAAGDAANKTYQQYEAKLASLVPLREQIATNIDFAFQTASDGEFEAFVNAPELVEIRFTLEEMRHRAGHRLPKSEELLAAALDVDGLHGWGRLYDRLSGALRVSIMERGEVVEKSVGQVRFDSPDPGVRENNYFAGERAWAGIADSCADAINHIAGNRLQKYERLGLTDHLDVPLRLNRIRRETLEAMWSAVAANKQPVVAYREAKAKLLGLKKLAWWDEQAPLPSAAGSEKITYDKACANIIETFTSFSPEFGEFAEMSLADGWIEAENRQGKRQGGFCTGFPTAKQSRIFMTYTDTADSMSTLAHELGHAYHSWVLRDQPFFLQHYPMGLAETASTFAEAVLGDQRLQLANSDDAKREILDTMLGDSVAFLMNIHCRFLFEDRFHNERKAGEVSTERLKELMVDAQKEAYAGTLPDDGCGPYFWASKLHFYITSYPFYNFPYTFGYLLSLGVYSLAEEFGDDFPARYRDLLIATGCKNAEDAVADTFGYDLSEPDFWEKSLAIVKRRVDAFLELA